MMEFQDRLQKDDEDKNITLKNYVSLVILEFFFYLTCLYFPHNHQKVFSYPVLMDYEKK